jgi:putative ABC transport system ATP-binding protein
LLRPGVPGAARRRRALEMLAALGLGDLADRRPGELSGGQQQRVAIARAIVTGPALLLADEPSANLDSVTTDSLLALLKQLNEERSLTIITATHDPQVMAYARRQVKLRDGLIVGDQVMETA